MLDAVLMRVHRLLLMHLLSVSKGQPTADTS